MRNLYLPLTTWTLADTRDKLFHESLPDPRSNRAAAQRILYWKNNGAGELYLAASWEGEFIKEQPLHVIIYFDGSYETEEDVERHLMMELIDQAVSHLHPERLKAIPSPQKRDFNKSADGDEK